MITRQTNKSSYRVTTEKGHYIVTLSCIKNTYSGNPRFEANIICLDAGDVYCFTQCYRFLGHYMSDYDEAVFIVKYAENAQD